MRCSRAIECTYVAAIFTKSRHSADTLRGMHRRDRPTDVSQPDACDRFFTDLR